MLRGNAAGALVMKKVCMADDAAESVTRAVKLEAPADVGVPVSAPVLDKDSPDGSVPEINVHE